MYCLWSPNDNGFLLPRSLVPLQTKVIGRRRWPASKKWCLPPTNHIPAIYHGKGVTSLVWNKPIDDCKWYIPFISPIWSWTWYIPSIYQVYTNVCSCIWYIPSIYYQSTVYTPYIYQHMFIYVARTALVILHLALPAWPSSIYQTYVLYKPTVASDNNDWTVASKAYAWRLLGMMPALSK